MQSIFCKLKKLDLKHGIIVLVMAGIMACGAGMARAQGTKAKPILPNKAYPEAFFVRRVIVLAPARPNRDAPAATPPSEQNISKYTTTRRKKSSRSRRRLFTLPGTPQNNAPPAPARASDKANASATPGRSGASAPSSVNSAKRKPADVVPDDQQSALAQSLLTDMVAERLHDRLGLTVVPEEDVNAALKTLRLSPVLIGDAAHRENTRRLCALLNCQALCVPRIASCTVYDGLTRDVTLFARVHIEVNMEINATSDLEPGSSALPTAHQPRARAEPEGVPADKWPANIDVAGAAFAERILFHASYQKPQGDLIRDAAGQAANLLAHALRTNEQAPFVRPTERLAVAPVVSPTRADKLVFTPEGRRVQANAARGLNADVSELFTPSLLPFLPGQIVEAPAVRKTLEEIGTTAAGLWKEDGLPDTSRVQALAGRLHADYMLMARVTDIELAEGAAEPAAVSQPAGRERAARVEAAAALVRASDGAILWRDRATSTMTAPSGTRADARSLQTDKSLVHDATRFALIELARRFRHYRADFEK